MSKPVRFADAGTELADFASHFFVACPKCGQRAVVRAGDHRLMCTACHHTETPGRWYGAARLSVSRRCPECGERDQRTVETTEIRPKLAMRCAACGDEREFAAQVQHLPFNHGLKTDPVYGLELWLQAPFRDELLWAYNPEHLAYLREYVGAGLRERGIEPRNTIRKNSSMLSRLPVFLKRAANREDLLKLMDKLESK